MVQSDDLREQFDSDYLEWSRAIITTARRPRLPPQPSRGFSVKFGRLVNVLPN